MAEGEVNVKALVHRLASEKAVLQRQLMEAEEKLGDAEELTAELRASEREERDGRVRAEGLLEELLD